MKKAVQILSDFLANTPVADLVLPEDLKRQVPLVKIPGHLKGSGPRRLVLHVGAHKTGTTSLQQLLRHNGVELGRQGVCAVGHFVPRIPWTSLPYGRRGYTQMVRPHLEAMRTLPEGEKEQRRATAAFADALILVAQGAPTIVYSDEAMFGRRMKNFKGLYPDAERQMRSVLEGFSGWDVKVILYVREQASYVEASYLQSILEGRHPETFERYLKRRADFEQLSWMDLADRIASVTGADSLFVERFERIQEVGFESFAKRYLSLFCDPSKMRIETIHRNPSLSAPGAELALKIRRHVSQTRWKEYQRLLEVDFSAKEGQRRAAFLSEQQRDWLQARYAGDCHATEQKYSLERIIPRNFDLPR